MIILIFFLFSFIFLYVYNKDLFFKYSLLFLLTARFIGFKTEFGFAPTILNVESIAFIILFFAEQKCFKYFKFIFFYIVMFVLYYLFLHQINDIDTLKYIVDYKSSLIYLLFGLLFIENYRYGRINIKGQIKFFILVLVFEIILCWLQLLNTNICDFFRITSYKWKGELLSLTGNSNDKMEANMMLGTLAAVTTTANYLCISYITLFTFYMKKHCLTKHNIILLSLILVTLLFNGTRSTFIISIIYTFIILFIYNKNYFKKVFICVLIIFIIFNTSFALLIGKSSQYANNRQSPFYRTISSFYLFADKNVTEESTLYLTYGMIPYATENPIFGIGQGYKKGYMLKDVKMYLDDHSNSDAQLTYVIAEIGIIGLLIYLLPFFYYLKILRYNKIRDYQILHIIITAVLLNTIIDSGLFDLNLLFIIYFSAAFSLCKEKLVVSKKLSKR